MSGATGLWLRWSWRDLRLHWVAVVVIAMVMGIGVGVYAGLGSTSTWRRLSNDASFAALDVHDLEARLSPGSFVAAGRLRDVLDDHGVGEPDVVDAVAERLVLESQVEVETDEETVLVEARMVGMDVAEPTTVDAVWVRDGRRPAVGSATAILEAKFADSWSLPPAGTLTVGGDRRIDYVGLGVSPEDFFYEGPEGSVFSDGDLAPLYVPLTTAQDFAGRPGVVNDLVLTVSDDADRDRVEARLEAALVDAGIGATITTRDDLVAVRVLYEDIDNDQKFWNILAGLVLAAAALAAFNLVSRVVEAQRREIGIGMALGVARWRLALRPMFVGVQVGVAGTAAGIGVGLLVGAAMSDLLQSVVPMPDHRSPFQYGLFGRAAVLALAVPIVASALPVWRAVRVEPIEAIRTGHLAARVGRLANVTGRLRLPGDTFTQMPLRNFLRTPRRTMLTALGVGAAVAALVAVFGMLDSIGRAVDETGAELETAGSDRMIVQLDSIHPADSDIVRAVDELPEVGHTDVGVRLPADAGEDGDDLDLLVEFVDLDSAAWTPTLVDGDSRAANGIILARKALSDLDLSLGDTVALRVVGRDERGNFMPIESDFVVSGVHANPLRSLAFADSQAAAGLGLGGQVNVIQAYPADGVSRSQLQHALFGTPGVASSQPVARISEAFDRALAQFVGILVVAAAAVLALAMLIAFNATRISVDERRREHATMRAFGVPVRSIIGVVVKESVLVGVLATGVGLAIGVIFLQVMLRSLASTTLPDLRIEAYISPVTIGVAVAVGVVAVAVTPLFLVRRVSQMDIPDTLRVME